MWYWCNVPVKKQTLVGIFTENKRSSIWQHFDNIVVTGGTVSCHNDNLWCHQWRQSCQIDDLLDLLFSVFLWFPIANITLTHKLLKYMGEWSALRLLKLWLYFITRASTAAVLITHPCISSSYSAEYVSSYASKQLQNLYHCEQNKISKIKIKSKWALIVYGFKFHLFLSREWMFIKVNVL